MESGIGVNRKTKNVILKDLMNKYNKTEDGISSDDLSKMAKESTSIFARPFVKKEISNKIAKMDVNKDDFISNEEMDTFLKDNYNIDFETASKMNMKDLTTHMKEIDKEKEARAENNERMQREIKNNKIKMEIVLELLKMQKMGH